jgi:separase
MSDAMKHTKFFMEELTTLIELSNASILERIPATFWSTRNALDKRVKGLLESVEHAWLGPWISFFIGKVYGSVSTDISFRSVIKTIATAIKKEAEKKSLCCLDEDLLQILCEGTPFLSKEMLFYGLSFLFGSSDRDFLESCNRIVDQWLNFIVSPTGKLEEDTRFDQIYGTLFTPMPVALIVGQSLELFPWESLPTLLKCDQSFYRIPNVRFLAASLEVFASQADSKESQCARLQKGENSNSVYYLLNPTNNLEKTEVKFKDRFESMEGWDGLSGRAPEPEALRSSLENKDVYIFFGHGAGSTYYRSLKNNLEGVNLHSSGFIIGCSSGRLRCDGDSLEPTGIPYRYLLNGSPSYVGVLWDVTDGDIDTFADNFMQEWFTRDVWSLPEGDPKHPLVIGKTLMRTSKELIGIKGPNLCDATTTARSSCKLKFLIGAAPVVYGLPLSVRVCLIPRSHWSATQTIRTIPAVTDKSHEMKSEKGKTKSSSTK